MACSHMVQLYSAGQRSMGGARWPMYSAGQGPVGCWTVEDIQREIRAKEVLENGGCTYRRVNASGVLEDGSRTAVLSRTYKG
jgi:hypothetical protein